MALLSFSRDKSLLPERGNTLSYSKAAPLMLRAAVLKILGTQKPIQLVISLKNNKMNQQKLGTLLKMMFTQMGYDSKKQRHLFERYLPATHFPHLYGQIRQNDSEDLLALTNFPMSYAYTRQY